VNETARDDGLRPRGYLVFSVEAVAQRRPLQAAFSQRLFGLPVVRGDRGRVLRYRVEVRCVDDVTYPRFSGRLDGGAVLADAGADDVGADKQQLLPALERPDEGLRPPEVGLPDLRPTLRQVG
jgi:hypothetical protein